MILKKLFSACVILVLSIPMVSVAQSADKASIPAIATDRESNYLVSVSQGLSVDVYNPQNQTLLYSIRISEFVKDFSGVSALAIDDANLLVACAVAKKNAPAAVYLFDLKSRKLCGIIPELSATPTRLAFSGSGRYLAASADHQGLLIYKIVHIRKAASSSAASLSDSEKEALRKLGYLEPQMIDPVPALQDKTITAGIAALSFDDRENLAIAADDGTLRLFDSNLKPVKTIKLKNGRKPSCLRFSPDGSRIAVSYGDKAAIDVYQSANLGYLYSPDTTDIASTFTGNLAWSADSRFLYAAVPTLQKNETDIYRWRNSGEGSRSHLKTVNDKTSRIAPVMGGGVVYNEAASGIALLDKQYGAVYNEKWLSAWVAVGYKHGDVTYEIGGDYSNSEGASGSDWFPISRLKWPIDAMMAGVDLTVRPFKRLELNGSFYHNITNNLGGKMEDSDWMFDPDLYGHTPDIYSESDTDFRGYVGDIQARFWILDRHYTNNSSFSLGVAAGFMHQSYDWEASNLDQWSPSGVYGTDHYYVSGPVITYKSQLYMPYLELAIKSKVGKIDIAGTIGGAPYLWAKDEDDHLLRRRLMTTDAHGYSVKAGLQTNYNFTPHWFAGARLNFLYFSAKGTQKGLQYETTSEADAGYRWDIEHEIKSFQLDALLLMGFRF